MNIQLLDENTINKIAAGEVVERPASVLKELLENAADSGAARIEIGFENGGKSFLSVTDNGSGIIPEDLLLAVTRHATSKIRSAEDLFHLHTLGFRGEALASIASVSEFRISSTPQKSDTGANLEVRFGSIGEIKPSPPLPGTTVEVAKLFENVPARLKFMKSDAGETAALKKVFKAFALSHPSVELILRQSGRNVMHFGKQAFKERSIQVLGLKDSEALCFEMEDLGIQARMTLALPQHNSPTSQNLWFFVGDRPVTDKTMQAALMEGYRGLIMHHQYPQGVVMLELQEGQVDFNVHPAKSQVRFQNPSHVFRFLSSAVQRAFQENLLKHEPEAEVIATPIHYQKIEGESSLGRAFAEGPSPSLFAGDQRVQYRAKPDMVPSTWASPQGRQVLETRGAWSHFQVIGQFANTYLVCQNQKGLCLVDQHAAHERVLFERLKREFESRGIAVQPSLMSEVISLEQEAAEALAQPEALESLKRLGFEVEPMGPQSIAVATRPLFLLDTPLKPLFEKLAQEFGQFSSIAALQDKMDDVFASMACHGAIRAGRTLNLEEMGSLLQQMDEFAFSSFCPHGRPVSFQMSLSEIEKEFKRIL